MVDYWLFWARLGLHTMQPGRSAGDLQNNFSRTLNLQADFLQFKSGLYYIIYTLNWRFLQFFFALNNLKTLKYIATLIGMLILTGCSLKDTEPVTDIHGNSYRTVRIGEQIWMAEDLRATQLNDGTTLENISGNKMWKQTRQPGFCWYDNDSSSLHLGYGVLYNYHAIKSNSICPEGWRIPTMKDFQRLILTLDESSDTNRFEISMCAGNLLKRKDSIFWGGNFDTVVVSGFNAIPGGCRSFDGMFSLKGNSGYYGGKPSQTALIIRDNSASAFLRIGISENTGVAVRCIKNKEN